MAEENKSGPVTGAIATLVIIAVASWFFNENMIAPRNSRVVAPATVSTVVGADPVSAPSGTPTGLIRTGQIQAVEDHGCSPGSTHTLVDGRIVECAASVPQTTGGCWRNRRTGESVCNRTFEQGPPPVQTSAETAQAPPAPAPENQNLAGPPS